MTALISSFKQFLYQISKDKMLIIVIFDPVLTGIMFKFGIPIAEDIITNYFGVSTILSPYYLLFDIILAMVIPYIFCFVSAMVILEEVDSKVAEYMYITPIGKTGYLISRLCFPMIISILVSIPILLLFSLTEISIARIVFLSFFACCIGLMAALIIVAFSSNKVEGMAYAKFGGIIFLGAPIPFFLNGNEQYIGAFIPSFWISKLSLEFNILNLLFAALISAVWLIILFKRFIMKVV